MPGTDLHRPEVPPALIVSAAGKIAIAVGLLVLIGWFFNLENLKRLSPKFVAMNPVTAICFVLIGISFECRRRRSAAGIVRFLGFGLAMIVAIAAGAKLGSYIMGLPLRLDALLFGLAPEEVASRIPNQMAPNTAFNFVLLGLALFLLDAGPRQFPICNLLALVAIATALLAVVGYAYGVTQFTRVSTVFIPMALHTAIALLVLSFGILFARADAPLTQIFATQGAARLVATRLFPAAIVVVFCLGWLRLYGERNGYFPGALGTALFVVTVVFILVGLIWWTASSLNELEISRSAAERETARSRKELEASLSNLQLVMNHACELICSLDVDGRVLSMNEASVQLLGARPEQLVGINFRDFVHPDDRAAWDSGFHQTQSLAAASITLRLRRRDESFVPIVWSCQASEYHRKVFAVGRAQAVQDSFRPWEHAS